MGIKHLNKFITSECPSSIRNISLSELSGKKIVVDISIYMFKFSVDGGLVENMYILMSVLKNYNITPVFVFDGKSPYEKKELVQQRRETRENMQKDYDKVQMDLTVEEDDDRKQELITSLRSLSKKIVMIKNIDFDNVKKLITAFGFMYIDAPGEADPLCAYLCLNGQVWGCLSDDMDMFVYGCPRVIRFLNLFKNTASLYDNASILSTLRVSQPEMRDICILSGTDYNVKSKHAITLYQVLNLFKKYKKKQKGNHLSFSAWVMDNTEYIEDDTLFRQITRMFTLEDEYDLSNTKYNIKRSNYDSLVINEMLMGEGFIIPN